MATSITTLVKVITLQNNATTQSGANSILDPQMVPDLGNYQKVSRIPRGRRKRSTATPRVYQPTRFKILLVRTFLELAFGLKKPTDNKTHKTWEFKFWIPKCEVTSCPKLNTIIKEVVKKDAVDDDRELSRLQNFFLDTVGPLVAAFEELSKEKPDADLTLPSYNKPYCFWGTPVPI